MPDLIHQHPGNNSAPSLRLISLLFPILALLFSNPASSNECSNWQQTHPEWLWCDSFEESTALNTRYEDVSTTGLARSTADAVEGEASLRQVYTPGQVSAGWVIKVEPNGFPDHLFYRWHHKFGDGYDTFPPKMARAGYRERGTSWQEIFRVHTWISGNQPTLDVLARNSSQGPWLPVAISDFNLNDNRDQWNLYEVEIKLNSPGNTDGLYRMWINNQLMVERTNVDLRGNTSDKINEVMLDAYWNTGASATLERFFDNFVISTERIGSITSENPPMPPSNIRSERTP